MMGLYAGIRSDSHTLHFQKWMCGLPLPLDKCRN
jgi:hypothetical protein